MSTNLLDRLDSLIETAGLEHEVSSLHGGSGNREFESSRGALEALRNARDILVQSEDPTSTRVVGHIVRNILHMRLFGFLPLPSSKGPEWLHIGDMNELQNGKSEHGIRVEHEVIDRIEGTRQQVLRAYLERKKRP